MIGIIGLVMLAEGEPKPHRRQTEATCGAPVARFGDWVGPFQLRMIRGQLNFHINQISFDAPIDSRDYRNNSDSVLTLQGTCHSSKSSFCVSFACHFSAFSNFDCLNLKFVTQYQSE